METDTGLNDFFQSLDSNGLIVVIGYSGSAYCPKREEIDKICEKSRKTNSF